ncbi:MAG: tetratricopeptide repeat protein [Verrucomicrobia bacterium]|nr:tetratricopeptide repeat protein [Verrucomicrobiota bacterium]
MAAAMSLQRAVCLGVLLIGLLGLFGCANGWQRGATARPGQAPGVAEPARLDDAAIERRAELHARYAAGVVHDLRGEPELALEQFWQATLADPSNELLAIDLAHRLLQGRDAQRAVEVLSRAAAQPGATGLASGWLGLALGQLGRTEEALAANGEAIRRSPTLLMGYYNLAQIHFQRKQPDAALTVLDQAGRQPGGSAGFLAELAGMLLGAQRAKHLTAEQVKPRVLALLERAVQLQPQDPLALQRLAEAFKNVGEPGRAAQFYEELLARHTAVDAAFAPILHEQLFQLYRASGNPAKASEHLRHILREMPTNPQAYLLLGTLAVEEKKFEEAADHFEKALLLNPELEPAYYDLAGFYLLIRQPERALEVLAKARAKFSLNFGLEFYTGVAQAALKQYAGAIKSYTSAELLAKATDPSRLNHAFYFQLGSAQERLGRYAEAERSLRRCLELAPDNAETLNYLGYMWAERGENLEEARQFIARAVALEPENAAFLDSLAWVLHQLGQSREALPHQLKAVANSEEPDAILFDHLGDIYEVLGDKAAACDAWRQSLAVEESEAVRRKLEASSPP